MSALSSLHQPDIFLIRETKMEEDAFLQVSKKFGNTRGKLQLAQVGLLAALELCGMTRNMTMLISSTALTGSSPS